MCGANSSFEKLSSVGGPFNLRARPPPAGRCLCHANALGLFFFFCDNVIVICEMTVSIALQRVVRWFYYYIMIIFPVANQRVICECCVTEVKLSQILYENTGSDTKKRKVK